MEFNVPGYMPYESMPYGEIPYEYGMDYSPVYDVAEAMGLIMIFSVVAALILAVITFVFVVPDGRYNRLNGFWKRVADLLNFKTLYIEKILKFIYSVTTYMAIIAGIALFVYSLIDEYAGSDITRFGLILAIGGPVAVRFVYEIFMLSVIGVKNLVSINDKLKSVDADKCKNSKSYSQISVTLDDSENGFSVDANRGESESEVKDDGAPPESAGVNIPQYCYCTRCGTRYDSSIGSCPNGCGN